MTGAAAGPAPSGPSPDGEPAAPPDPTGNVGPFGPLTPFLTQQGFLVIDGGLATELEALGHDLSDDLWSARVLVDDPDALRMVHRSFLDAGADCIATATYQATFEGLGRRGLADAEVEALLTRAVGVALEARAALWAVPQARAGRFEPLVAASIGPYGAYLADGSEYRGDYGLSTAELYDFHARRWRVLAETAVDLMACETTPSLAETHAYCRLAAVSGRPTWISFQCADGSRIADGTPLEEAVSPCHDEPNVVCIGVNCTDPRHIAALIEAAKRGTDKPIVVYPNSGEGWDADARRWTGRATPVDWARSAREWWGAGAFGVGGCCRVRPTAIAAIRASLSEG